ncbi:ABC transporter ATP-binding protein [bacterium SCSIO 12741]|nr:ABC transporter ATP-binding protein [bacterium SCSIO 12741]
MIETHNLSKVFRTEDVETTALNQVDLHVKEGDFVAIMGPSGCGKSTLLNLLGMIDQPSSGQYLFNGEDISGYNEKQRAKVRKNNVGFIFQSFNLIDELSVYENVELPLIYAGMKSSERKTRVNEVLEKVNMAHRAKHFPLQLSGGQQQRVAVARALVNRPGFILADEPTGNLDSKNGQEVMSLLTELNEDGTTIVMVTHSSRDAEFADRIVRMLDGQVLMESKLQNA